MLRMAKDGLVVAMIACGEVVDHRFEAIEEDIKTHRTEIDISHSF